ncbi:hypothetical protein XENOCAPTIV_009523 [Xenoophorus captivus]|uniref:Uncharacterized protein n=1 Tax=Xenoophorus captivus TaxID=1517983 RepID=A0ABV0R7S1_9TELE
MMNRNDLRFQILMQRQNSVFFSAGLRSWSNDSGNTQRGLKRTQRQMGGEHVMCVCLVVLFSGAFKPEVSLVLLHLHFLDSQPSLYSSSFSTTLYFLGLHVFSNM